MKSQLKELEIILNDYASNSWQISQTHKENKAKKKPNNQEINMQKIKKTISNDKILAFKSLKPPLAIRKSQPNITESHLTL